MSVESFRLSVPQVQLDDLRARLMNTRWPEREPVGDDSQGIRLERVQQLCAYWAEGYDWRDREARLARVPQFTSVIDGLSIHFAHVRSSRANPTPIVLTHGWPGSFVEYLDVAHRLADRGFDVVIPSLPGYAFSEKPRTIGWGVPRIARAWAELMTRSGYDRFGAAGSDWGTSVSASLGQQFPDRVIGLHLIPPLAPPDPATLDALTPFEAAALRDLDRVNATESAYSAMHATKPQTVAYGLVDSPAALCSWMLEKFWSWTDHDGDLYDVIDRDLLLDNLMMYWLPATGGSSIRLYRESFEYVWQLFNGGHPEPIVVPVGASVFPKEVPRVSRRWAARRFTDIRYWSEPERGGHFAALEQPETVAHDIAATFASVRLVE